MSDSETKPGEKKLITIKNAADLQRLKIEKLMKNPDKLVVIPERPKQKALAAPPDFVRNVMGSSAGAGSGEFHVYRHLRRKEYARQKFIQEKSEKEKLDEEYHTKIEQNKLAAESKTAKKRAKRLRKKKNAKLKGKKPKTLNQQQALSSQSDNSSEEDDEEETKDTIENTRVSGDSKSIGEKESVDKQSEGGISEHNEDPAESTKHPTNASNNEHNENVTVCKDDNCEEKNDLERRLSSSGSNTVKEGHAPDKQLEGTTSEQHDKSPDESSK